MSRTRRPYRRDCPPKDIGETSVAAPIPSEATRAKREALERQWSTNTQRKALRGGGYLWARTGPVSSDGKYCITVKIYNAKIQDYWLPYNQAATLWQDVTGDTLENAIREDLGLPSLDREPIASKRKHELDSESMAMLDAIGGG